MIEQNGGRPACLWATLWRYDVRKAGQKDGQGTGHVTNGMCNIVSRESTALGLFVLSFIRLILCESNKNLP